MSADTHPTSEERMTARGFKTQLSNGATVGVHIRPDGGAYLVFERDGNKTPLCLSGEAMGVVCEMWTELTWGQSCKSK